MFLNQIFAREVAEVTNLLVLRTLNFLGGTMKPIVPRQKHFTAKVRRNRERII